MKRMKPMIFILVLIFTIGSISVYAYRLFSYRLIGGVYNRQYTIQGNEIVSYGGEVLNYGAYVRDSFNNWNNAVNSTNTLEDVLITETSDVTQSEFDFYCMDYGETPWIGWTNYHDLNNISINPDHQAPTTDWKYSEININVRKLVQDKVILGGDSGIRGTFAHEIGHALCLSHVTLNTAVMYNDFPQPEVPNYDDVNGVKAAY